MLPDIVLVIRDGEVVFELMKAQFHGLALVVQEVLDTIPLRASRFFLQGLIIGDDAFVSGSPPQSLIVFG